jgi:hypothetical protein
MPKKHRGAEYEKELKQQRALQRQVLEQLKEYGPKNCDALYVHFDLLISGQFFEHRKLSFPQSIQLAPSPLFLRDIPAHSLLTACMRKLLITLNAMLKHRTPWRTELVQCA